MGNSYPGWKPRPVQPVFRDCDFAVKFWPEPGDHEMRGFAALEKFHAPVESEKITSETFARPGLTYPIGSAPLGIDILIQPSGIAFDQPWRDRGEGSISGVPFHFSWLPQPIANEPAIGRRRDVEQWKRISRKAESGRQAFL